MKKTIIILGAVIIIALVAIIIITNRPDQGSQESLTNSQNESQPADVLQGLAQDDFQAPMPENIKVPEANEVLPAEQAEKIAVPTVVTAAAPGAESKYRNFNIRAEGNKFSPSQIIVREGDTVQINFTAVDKDYDIVFPSYNMQQTAKQGETKMLAFQAVKSGNFTYYCNICGGPDSGVTGNIIVAP